MDNLTDAEIVKMVKGVRVEAIAREFIANVRRFERNAVYMSEVRHIRGRIEAHEALWNWRRPWLMPLYFIRSGQFWRDMRAIDRLMDLVDVKWTRIPEMRAEIDAYIQRHADAGR